MKEVLEKAILKLNSRGELTEGQKKRLKILETRMEKITPKATLKEKTFVKKVTDKLKS